MITKDLFVKNIFLKTNKKSKQLTVDGQLNLKINTNVNEV